MAQSKAVATYSSSISPNFTTDLLPAAERTALLFQLSYLYLAGYTELEKIIRERALETRLLFVSSEKVMFKCLCTSDNLVKSLFPILKVAVNKNKTQLAKTYLAKAQGWITEIVDDAKEMVDAYEKENKALSATTSTVYQKKQDKLETPGKIKTLETKLEEFRNQLEKIQKDKEAKQKDINEATSKRDSHISHMGACDARFATRTRFWFFWSSGASDKTVEKTHDSNRQIFNQLTQVVDTHMKEMANLKMKEQKIHNDMMAKKMEILDLELKGGSIPSPEHLEEVKHCLVRIQEVLVLILRFWNHVAAMLKGLEQKTFVSNELIDELEDCKEIFLESITKAEEAWQAFGQSCMKSQEVFHVQSKEGYKFLEMNPSTLPEDVKEKMICAVKERLDGIGQESALPELPASASTE